MAWYEEMLTQTPGSLIDVLDDVLPANPNWSIYDFDSANFWRVYRNLDVTANSEFYVFIDDSQNNYVSIEVWEDWDEVGDSGSGLRIPTIISGDTAYIRKPAGIMGISVKDLNIKFANLTLGVGSYVGQLNRCDSTKNMPILVAVSNSASAANSLGEYATIASCLWLILKNDVGAQESVSPFLSNNNDFRIRSSDGRYYLFDSLVHGWTSNRVFGQLDGVCSFAGSTISNGLLNMDVLWVGAQSWVALRSSIPDYCVMERS